MKTLLLDANGWQDADDVYDAFFGAIGAPAWHGRNFNALRDSIAAGSVNEIELPYEILVKDTAKATANAKQFLNDFKALIEELAAGGMPISIRLD